MHNIAEAVQDGTKGFKGVYVVTKAKIETDEQRALNDKVVVARNVMAELYEQLESLPRGGILTMREQQLKLDIARLMEEAQAIFTGLVRELNSKCKTTKEVYENIVPTVGRTLIANNLTNVSPTNLMLIKYAEVGSGTNTPANGDTAMQTSTYRNAIASRTNAANIAYATAFFSATETSGTYREAGIFSDGSASAGTGVLVSRVAVNITKTTSETLTIDWTLTIS